MQMQFDAGRFNAVCASNGTTSFSVAAKSMKTLLYTEQIVSSH